MDYGMPTLIELENLEENCALCHELGLDFVEINMNFPEFQSEFFAVEKYASLKEKYGIYFTIHLPENLDVAEVNESVRRAWFETVEETISFARKISCPVINMHMNHGVYVTLPDEKNYVYERKNDEYMKAVSCFRNFCAEKIGDSGILICIENTDGFRDFEKRAVNYLLELPCFGLTWDVGHSISCDESDMEYLLANVGSLKHFHIHDGTRKSGGARCHLDLGRGEVNLDARISLAKECDARCVIETKTVKSLKNSIEWLSCKGLL